MQHDYNIYALRHIATGRYYFGLTRSSVRDRWLAHVQSAKPGRATTPIANAIRAEGASAFEVIPMLRGLSKQDADEWERTLVERYERVGVLNDQFTERARKRSSVLHKGRRASVETRQKQSESHRARWAALSTEARSTLNKARSEAGVKARLAAHPPMSLEERRIKWRLKAKRARDRRKAAK